MVLVAAERVLRTAKSAAGPSISVQPAESELRSNTAGKLTALDVLPSSPPECGPWTSLDPAWTMGSASSPWIDLGLFSRTVGEEGNTGKNLSTVSALRSSKGERFTL